MRRFGMGVMMGVAMLGLSASAAAQTVVKENGAVRTIACDGGDVIVNGNKGDLTLTGNCKLLKINGNKNKVIFASTKKLVVKGNKNKAVGVVKVKVKVVGNRNKVRWIRHEDGGRPTVKDKGNNNDVKKKVRP